MGAKVPTPVTDFPATGQLSQETKTDLRWGVDTLCFELNKAAIPVVAVGNFSSHMQTASLSSQLQRTLQGEAPTSAAPKARARYRWSREVA